tara:strand:- start:292 stop:540 length:249 start_codon:yes stop_codon:yes gene_type:complete
VGIFVSHDLKATFKSCDVTAMVKTTTFIRGIITLVNVNLLQHRAVVVGGQFIEVYNNLTTVVENKTRKSPKVVDRAFDFVLA